MIGWSRPADNRKRKFLCSDFLNFPAIWSVEIFLKMSQQLSLCLTVCLFICLSVCLSVCPEFLFVCLCWFSNKLKNCEICWRSEWPKVWQSPVHSLFHPLPVACLSILPTFYCLLFLPDCFWLVVKTYIYRSGSRCLHGTACLCCCLAFSTCMFSCADCHNIVLRVQGVNHCRNLVSHVLLGENLWNLTEISETDDYLRNLLRIIGITRESLKESIRNPWNLSESL